MDERAVMQDDETYPTSMDEQGEEVYDNQIAPLLAEAHEIAARHGLPIMSYVVYDDGHVANHVTIKNVRDVPPHMLASVMLMDGNHPEHLGMLAALVEISGDTLLALSLSNALVKAAGVEMSGDTTPEQKVRAAMVALRSHMASLRAARLAAQEGEPN
jgi:hypothetical protein